MAQNTVISPGYPLPTDTSGKNIHAHGGGILKVGTLYHWYGTSIKTQPGWLSEGITLYTSTDLGTWTDHGVVFHNTSIVDVWQPGPYRIERPKVVFCAHTQKYVMYFHLDTSSFSMGAVGVAQSANPKGPFEWVHGFQPDGQRSLDMGLYAEGDSAWLVRSVDNQYAGISKLTQDFLNTTGIVSRGPKMEGQCIFKSGGRYYLLGSHLTGWSPNAAILAWSPNLSGASWTSLGNPSGSSTTFNSQSTFVLPYIHPNTGKELFIYMGDDWNNSGVGSVSNATYVWLPMQPADHDSFSFTWHDHWKIGDF